MSWVLLDGECHAYFFFNLEASKYLEMRAG